MSTSTSPLASLLSGVHAVYDRIESDRLGFMHRLADLHISMGCPDSCGSCCHGFTPDITRAEASYIASWLLDRLPAGMDTDNLDGIAAALGKQASTPPHPGTCPFHDSARKGKNCLIYPARATLCRLFGFSAMYHRDGGINFTLCRHMPTPSTSGGLPLSGNTAGELSAWLDRGEIPRMADYGWQLRALDAGQAEASLLTEMLPRELHRVAMLRHYSMLEWSSGDAGPNVA